MKIIAFALFWSLFSFLKATDKQLITVESEIKEVTVYFNQAQIDRKAIKQLPIGESEIHFVGLSPHIFKESVRVKGNGNFTILGTSYINNFLEDLSESPEVLTLKEKIKEHELAYNKLNIQYRLLDDREDFLEINSDFSGGDELLTPEELQKHYNFILTELQKVRTQRLDLDEELNEQSKELEKLKKQLREMLLPSKTNTGVIVLKVSASQSTTATFELSYLVNKVQWTPEYDLRVKDTSNPLELNLKAKVQQTTGVDWKGVKMKFSNAQPSESGQIPSFEPFYLDFQQSISKALSGRAAGIRVQESEEIALDEVVVTSANGNPGSASGVRIRGASSSSIDVEPLYVMNGVVIDSDTFASLNPNEIANVQVLKDTAATSMYGSRGANGVILVQTKDAEFTSAQVNQKETFFEFELSSPYSLPSEPNAKEVQLTSTNTAANYKYQTLPRIQPEVFLVAEIDNWDQLNLLSGKVSLYYENTYVGEAFINSDNLKDALTLSLGIDRGIVVKRERDFAYNNRRVNGNTVEQMSSWEISARNTKKSSINLEIVDQYPVSRQKNIKVKLENDGQAKVDEDQGKLTWRVEIPPGQTVKRKFSYEVKYPSKEPLNSYDF